MVRCVDKRGNAPTAMEKMKALSQRLKGDAPVGAEVNGAKVTQMKDKDAVGAHRKQGDCSPADTL